MTVHDGHEEAHRVYAALLYMRRSPSLALDGAVLVGKCKRGRVSLRVERKLTPGQDVKVRTLSRRLAEILYGVSQAEAVRSLVGAGMDEVFVANVVGAVDNDTSSLLLVIPAGETALADETVKVLSLFSGEIHRTALPGKLEAALRA